MYNFLEEKKQKHENEKRGREGGRVASLHPIIPKMYTASRHWLPVEIVENQFPIYTVKMVLALTGEKHTFGQVVFSWHS